MPYKGKTARHLTALNKRRDEKIVFGLENRKKIYVGVYISFSKSRHLNASSGNKRILTGNVQPRTDYKW